MAVPRSKRPWSSKCGGAQSTGIMRKGSAPANTSPERSYVLDRGYAELPRTSLLGNWVHKGSEGGRHRAAAHEAEERAEVASGREACYEQALKGRLEILV